MRGMEILISLYPKFLRRYDVFFLVYGLRESDKGADNDSSDVWHTDFILHIVISLNSRIGSYIAELLSCFENIDNFQVNELRVYGYTGLILSLLLCK